MILRGAISGAGARLPGGIVVVEAASWQGPTTNYTFVEPVLENDIIFVATCAHDSGKVGKLLNSTYGYTNFTAAMTSFNNLPYMSGDYKRMGPSPDTSVIVGNGSGPSAHGVYLLRGVDPVTALDVTSPDRGASTPNTITPVTDGAVIIQCGGLDDDTGSFVTSYPGPGYGNNLSQSAGGANFASATLGMCLKIQETAGAESPSAWGWSSSDGTRCFNCAFRPAA